MILNKKVVLVTGSSSGIGKEIAKTFLQNGFFVVINGYNRENLLNKTLTELRCISKDVISIKCDVSNYLDVISMFKQIGDVDILINNAGISHIGLFGDTTPSIWKDVIGVNLEGTINCSHIAVKHMIYNKFGCIINISSIWGNVGASCEVIYSATKGGINSFTKALAKELAPSNIRVNAISCGIIETNMNSFLSENERALLINDIPSMRFGTPSEVANLAFYLASDNSSYLTGQIITIDGGFL